MPTGASAYRRAFAWQQVARMPEGHRHTGRTFVWQQVTRMPGGIGIPVGTHVPAGRSYGGGASACWRGTRLAAKALTLWHSTNVNVAT